mgnify:FL=1|tara:strand:- start:1039 stop:1377 length:339 start_codon:yes stop_codon:yes gene_type:complete
MAQITIELPSNIQNDSLQVGDTIYSGYFTSGPSSLNTPIYVGVLTAILNNNTLHIWDAAHTPAAGDFIMFSKNKAVNNTSLLGYYARVKLANNSLEHAELFALNSEVAPSSK